MNIPFIISLAISIVLVGWAFFIVSPQGSGGVTGSTETVSVADGVQTIDITARGGYLPRVVAAKAGVPTILRVTTSGTFDCSSSLVIPRLSYQKFLQSSGVEEIAIPAEQAQGTLRGLCSMGMYGFQIKFQ